MSDNLIAFLFFVVGMIFTLAGMALGPFGIQNWSIACSAMGISLALVGMFFGISSWREKAIPKEEKLPKTGADVPKEEQGKK